MAPAVYRKSQAQKGCPATWCVKGGRVKCLQRCTQGWVDAEKVAPWLDCRTTYGLQEAAASELDALHASFKKETGGCPSGWTCCLIPAGSTGSSHNVCLKDPPLQGKPRCKFSTECDYNTAVQAELVDGEVVEPRGREAYIPDIDEDDFPAGLEKAMLDDEQVDRSSKDAKRQQRCSDHYVCCAPMPEDPDAPRVRRLPPDSRAPVAACANVKYCKDFKPKPNRGVPTDLVYEKAYHTYGGEDCKNAHHWVKLGANEDDAFERVDIQQGAILVDSALIKEVPATLWQQPEFQTLVSARSTEGMGFYQFNGVCEDALLNHVKFMLKNLYTLEELLDDRHRDNGEHMLGLIRHQWRAIRWASLRLRSHPNFVKEAMYSNPQALHFASEAIQSLKDVQEWARAGQ